MTGNIGKEGGEVRYGHLQAWGFNYNAMVQKQPEGSAGAFPITAFNFGSDCPVLFILANVERALFFQNLIIQYLNGPDTEYRAALEKNCGH